MFRTNAEIREAARQHVRAEGIKEGVKEGIKIGAQRVEDKLRATLEEIGVVLSPEDADRVFNRRNGKKS